MPRPERQLDPTGSVVEQFAAELRRLRDGAGRPGYRELAEQAHFSTTTLSEAAGGRRMPSLAVTLAFVEVCGGDRREWVGRWQAARAELLGPAPDGSRQGNGNRPPYRGLAPYEAADAEWFFGRAELLDEILRLLAGRRFLAVFGASGIGKSSLLRAGLLPAAEQGRLRPGSEVVTLLVTPGAHPLEELAVRLAPMANVAAGTLLADLRAGPDRLHLAIRQALASRVPDAELLLVVDQFEDVFRLCPDESERASTVAALVAAARAEDSRVRVVLGVRADFYAHIGGYPDLVAALREAHLLVTPMSPPELRAAVTQPAAHAGLTVEGDLVSVIVAEATGRVGALPLVSHALLEAWRRRRGMTLTLAGYTESGGVDGAIAQTAERVYADLDPAGQRTMHRALLRLVDVGEDGEAGRRRVDVAEFDLADPRTVAVLRRLADARLLTFGDATVEIAHEALLRAWPRLSDWIVEDREYLRLHRQLTEATAIWQAHDRDAGALYRGTRLASAREWAARHGARMTPKEREFLAASTAAGARESSARRRRIRVAIGALAAAVLIDSTLAGWALHESSQARTERNIAFSRQVAAEARQQLDVDPELAVLLADRAYAARPTQEADAVLRQAVLASRIRRVLAEPDGPVYAVSFTADGRRLLTAADNGVVRLSPVDGAGTATVFRGHQGNVWGATLSPDGVHLATGGGDKTVRLWRVADPGRSTILGRHDATVRNVAFSPDGKRLASASDDGTVKIWDLTGRDAPRVLRGHDGPVLAVAFSPDGQVLATGGNDRTIRLWPRSGGPVTVLRGHTASVEYLAYSPDGHHLASASTDGTARVWPLPGGEPLVLRGHDGTVESVAFSPDGTWVATTGNDRTVRLWRAGSAVHPQILRGHRGTVWTTSFSPDGRRLASASDDGTVRIWDPTLAGDPVALTGHVGPVWNGAVSADGRYAASAGRDHTVRVWDLRGTRRPVVLTGHTGEVASVDLSRDGGKVVSGSLDGTVRVWDRASGAPVGVYSGHDGSVTQVAFGPDGRWVASGGADGTVRVWPAGGHGAPVVLRGGAGPVRVWFSADGRRLAGAGWDGTVRLWDWTRGTPPLVLRGHEGPVWAASFSPDGRRVVSAGSDGTVRVWPADGRGPAIVLGAHQGVAWSAQFSADGKTVVSAGSDATVRVWPAAGAAEPVVFSGFGASVESVAVSVTGQLLTTHGDGLVQVWRCPVCGPIGEVRAAVRTHVTRALTVAERRLYLNERVI